MSDKLESIEAGHSIKCITHAGHSIAFNIFFTLCDPVTLTFDLWPNINWWARYHDGQSLGKFSDCTLSRFGFIVHTDRQTDRITDVDKRLTPATVVGVNK